jgi:CheY-like chemotaxis protein
MGNYTYRSMAYILVVDDEGDSRDFVARLLERRGHRVLCAENGRKALKQLLNAQPELLILDLRMPELDGIGLLEVLRSYLRWHDLPVIVLSAHGSEAELGRARELGVSQIFHKANFVLADLAAAVDRLLTGGSDTLAG